MNSKALASLIPLALVAGGWLYFQTHTQPLTGVDNNDQKRNSVSVVNNASTQAIKTQAEIQKEPEVESSSDLRGTKAETETETALDITSVGLAPLSDEEYSKVQAQLKQSEALLDQLLEEFRYNTNPQRARQLAALLSQHNLTKVVDVAAELAYSGDPVSQKMGLDLLSRLQPDNSRARDIAIELLSTEDNPSLLVSTMNVLATPARSATPDQRSALLDNTTLLATHNNEQVRSHSVALIGRWNQNDGVMTLENALSDNSPQVRARAVSALFGLDNPNTNIINSLLLIAENSSEEKTTRQSALQTLRDMPLADADRQRYRLAQVSVRTRKLNSQ